MTANMYNRWTPQYVGQSISKWFDEGHFDLELLALDRHKAKFPDMRLKARTSVTYLHFLFGELHGDGLPEIAVKNALSSLQVPVSYTGKIDIEDLEKLRRMFREGQHDHQEA